MPDPLGPETLSSTANTKGVFDEGSASGCVLLVVSDSGIRNVELLPGRVLRVGRRSEMDVVIEHPLVSREHAVFHGGYPPEVEDLGSRNGTTVQGTRIQPRQRVPLRPGYVVGFGNVNVFIRGHGGSQRPDSNDDTNPGAEAPNFAHTPRSRHREIHELHERARLVAQSSITILIVGETGSGKEVLAECVHACSPLSKKPLLRVNCAAFSEGILASQLFGHEKGAFTGAHATKIGLFEAADGGTLFLDEIGELALATQAKLLRVLERGEVTRVGAHTPRHVDVRVISATNRDLRARVGSGQFRSDLYFRLNGITLTIPPLRKRPDDIIPLAHFFAERFAERLNSGTPVLSEDAKLVLQRYRWPGNVRELKTVIERALILSDGGLISANLLQLDGGFTREHEASDRPEDHGPSSSQPGLPPPSSQANDASNGEPARKSSPVRPRPKTERSLAEDLRNELARADRERIVEALKQAGTQAGAAQILGMSRRTLIYKLDALDIPRPRKGRSS
jgi:DNA-binding NtrC family response regulator